MRIRWDDFEPGQYENMVSVLLSRLHPDARRVDGTGGDGGRDVQIVGWPDGLIIRAFELKSFTGRVNSARRQQVARSLKRAAALHPARWTLVVPIDPTPVEDKWFRGLGDDYGFPIDWYGKTWLDENMSAFPDIRRYFMEGANGEVVRLLRELHGEQARITDVHGAVARLGTLHKRLNEIDPHYRYEMSTVTDETNVWRSDVVFAVRLGDVRVDVYPKYSGATEDRPVTVNFMVAMEPEYFAIQESLDYGQAATIPRHIISNLTIDAPSGLGGSFADVELELSPADIQVREPIALALDVMDGDNIIASCPIKITEQMGGSKGFILSGTDSTSWLEVQMKIKIEDGEVEAQFKLNPKPELPAALVPLFRWLNACQPPRRLEIRGPEGMEICSELNGPILEDGTLGTVVEALAYLQEYSGVYREIPASLTREQGHAIVTAAALVRGQTVAFKWTSFSVNSVRWGPELEELASGRVQQFMLEYETALNIEGLEIPIGRIRTHIPSARIADPESVQRDLRSGSSPSLRLVPGDSDQGQRVLVSGPR